MDLCMEPGNEQNRHYSLMSKVLDFSLPLFSEPFRPSTRISLAIEGHLQVQSQYVLTR